MMKLLEPIQVGGLRVKNRIVMPPMGMGYANEDGTVSDRVINYYLRRAQSGVGMIVVENCIVDPDVMGVGPELRIHGDHYIEGLAKLVRAVKQYDVVVGIQLNHMGRQTTLGTPIGPSPIPISPKGPTPKVLTADDVRAVAQEFIDGARRGREAGFDFVEIHGAHGYLVCEFMSPFSNFREDEFGGSFENRMRFPLEIIEGIKKIAGEGYPIQFRFSGSEYVPDGLTINDTMQIAQILEKAGVASISVSAGNWQTLHYIMAPMFMPKAYLAEDAAKIKSVVQVPVIAVGRIHDVDVAEKVLQDEKADMVAVGRGLIADPEWAQKIIEDRVGDIRPCISCNYCVDFVSRALDAKCTVNAELGEELTFQILPALHRKRIVVVGSGPAGLEASRVAASRGHEVLLFEKETRLGGKLHLSAAAPSKREVNRFTDYLVRQIHKHRVKVELGVSLTRDELLGLEPDVIVLATGSVPSVPPIVGVNRPNVAVAEDVLLDRVQVGHKVVIVGGGGTGCDVAEYLMDRGREIVILEMLSQIGKGVEAITRRWMYYEFKKAGIQMLTKHMIARIEDSRAVYTDEHDREGYFECDAVVIAMGYRPSDDLAFCEEEGFPIQAYRIGDCVRPGTILDAVAQGAHLAAKL
ncbi:MAG: FAD-dependent oxidoreductase [Acidobacteria bacterium]|nr:FAD-dependent oxidoreductase [Acidobacteriota bacterium]